MKKWFKLHKKQIFAIICVFMLSLSCVTFVSADDEQQYYNIPIVTDVSICGLYRSDLINSGFVFPAFIYEHDCSVINRYVNQELAFNAEFNSFMAQNDFYFDVYVDSPVGDSYGVSSITLSDFYIPFTTAESEVFLFSAKNDNGYFTSESEVVIYYSVIGSNEILSNTLYVLIESADATIIFTDAFDGINSDVYVHSVTLTTPANVLADSPIFGIKVFTDTSFNGRSADIDRADSNNSGGILSSLFDVFTSVTQWLVYSLVTVVSLFFADGKFTVIGILSIIATGISVVLLLISIITAYLRFRG